MSYSINGKDVTKEEYIKFVKETTPKASWFECPAEGGNEVPAMRCMVCPVGHMTECHYPLPCHEAECDHWQQTAEFEY